jgi:hypothetical protein
MISLSDAGPDFDIFLSLLREEELTARQFVTVMTAKAKLQRLTAFDSPSNCEESKAYHIWCLSSMSSLGGMLLSARSLCRTETITC